MMDALHSVMRTLGAEAKSDPDHLRVFREFLRHLDGIRSKPPARPPAAKAPPRRKPAKRARRG